MEVCKARGLFCCNYLEGRKEEVLISSQEGVILQSGFDVVLTSSQEWMLGLLQGEGGNYLEVT